MALLSMAGCGGVATCPSWQTDCAGTCVTLGTDRANCGACGTVCPAGQVCSAGACAADCGGGLTNCDGTCRDLMTDANHCGSCTKACPAGNVCSAGACALSCPVGLKDCGGSCRDVQTDRAHCGTCGNACAVGTVCAMGSCALSCPAGLKDCGGSCRDVQSDRANCGTCGTACPAGNVCGNGACALSCQTGLTDCGGSCRDLQSDRAHCGQCGVACAQGSVCSNGACALSCQMGLTDCMGSCLDLQRDRANCGKCGAACAPGTVCSSGACALSCQIGLTDCMGSCRNLQGDNANCGACGAACAAGQSCQQGACVATCAMPLLVCANACIDPRFDPGNCGGCGMACSGSHVVVPVCSSATCVGTCAPTFGDCDNDRRGNGCEVDLTTDVKNCGACGMPCAAAAHATPACARSACLLASCDAGYLDCDAMYGDGCEVNGQTDPKNCGACSKACTTANAVTTCTKGACAISACSGTFLDCNGTYADGCEVDGSRDIANCGKCRNACPMDKPNCIQGVCTLKTFTTNCARRTGASSDLIAALDVDRDGDLDFVSAGNYLSINNGDGTFADPAVMDINRYGGVNTVGDFNGDGIADVAQLFGSISIYLGKGDGTFRPRTQFSSNKWSAQQATTGDFDGDGVVDLLVREFGRFYVMLGLGNGVDFIPQAYIDLKNAGGNGFALPRVGDFNEDKIPDFAFGLGSNVDGFAVAISQGDGTFKAPTNYPAIPYTFDVAVADLDGDKHLDILALASDAVSYGVVFYKGKGDGTFSKSTVSTVATPPNVVARGLALGDLDGDGNLDAVMRSSCTGSVNVLLGDGKGGFTPKGPLYQAYIAGGSCTDAVAPLVADFDNDKRLDVLVGNAYLRGNGDGTLQGCTMLAATLDGDISITGADLDADGRADFLLSTQKGLLPYYGAGDGTFAAGSAITNSATALAAVGDVDGDNRPDVVSFSNPNTTSVWLGLGGRAWKAGPAGPKFGTTTLGLGDADGDGKLDLLENGTYLKGGGDGTFTPILAVLAGSWMPVIGDFDGDGKLDLVNSDKYSLFIDFMKGLGKGGWGAAVTSRGNGYQPTAADLNGDGKLDVIVGGETFVGNGDGTFKAGSGTWSNCSGRALVADWNRDGYLDLMTTCGMLLGNGDGTVSQRPIGGIPGGGTDYSAMLDANGDGKPDLVTAYSTGAAIIVLNTSK